MKNFHNTLRTGAGLLLVIFCVMWLTPAAIAQVNSVSNSAQQDIVGQALIGSGISLQAFESEFTAAERLLVAASLESKALFDENESLMNRFNAFMNANEVRGENPARSLANVLLDESFADEAFPPAGWSTFKLEGDGTAAWLRDTVQSNTPPASARRIFGGSADGFQDDWLVTPVISVPTDGAQLVYFNRGQWMGDYGYSGVWASVGSCNPADGDFVELVETPDIPNLAWGEESVNLADFAGEDVCLAFRYSGTFAHTYWVDDVVVSSVDAVGDDIVLNGAFDNGLDNWTPFIADFAGVSADIAVVDGEAAITNISGAGGEVWYVQLNQVFTQDQIDLLEIGETYKIQFDARSSADGRQLRSYFGENEGGFVPVNITDFEITTSMETYEATFELTQTFGNMKLGFEMGLSNEDVFIDNVSMMAAEGEASPPPAPVGFVANDSNTEGPGEVFLAVGPNNVGGDIIYRLFYSPTAEAPGDPLTATEYAFGSTDGDGNGQGPFGFVLSGLAPATDYTFWLYQFDSANELFSEPGIASAESTGEGEEPVASVDPEFLDFVVAAGDSDMADLTLSNLGGADLEYTITVEDAAARNYSNNVITQFSSPTGFDRANDLGLASRIAVDAVVEPAAGLMAIGEFTEGFADIETLPGDGWSLQNLSNPVGSTTWFQGNATTFPSFSGEPSHYIGANFNSTGGTGTINTWLLTPEVDMENGTELRFYTRSTEANTFPDRLQIRLSTSGASTDAGDSATNVGDFDTLLLDINEDYATGYPGEWTEFVVTVEGLSAPTTGRFAFRYFVENGGPTGTNSDYIGIDEVSVTQPNGGEPPVVLPITVSPEEGSVMAGGQDVLNVMANTAGLAGGSYFYNILVASNDPANGLIVVPVSLEVDDDAFAQVQVIHNAADPALAEVDVYVNGDLFASNFPFRGATEYLTVPANQALLLEIMAPGGTEALLSLEATPEEDQVLAVIAQGVADPSDFAANPSGEDIGAELVVLDERQVGAPDEDTFSFYVFHGATDAPAVDIFVRELGANILTDVPYGVGSGYFDVPEGSYAIEVRAAGASSAVAVFFADVEGLGGLSAGILASGFLNPANNQDGEAFALLVVLEDGTTVVLEGLSGPSLSVNPAELAFGNVVEGFDRTLPITFTNQGTSNLTLLSVSIDNSAYSIDFEDADIVSPGSSRTFNVTFAPDAVGAFDGELTINSTDPNSPTIVPLSGNGVLAPGFAVDPDEIVATLAAGDTGTFDLTISNEGDGELEFSFPAYIMERILDGNDTAFDAVRERMIKRVVSVFEDTEEARAANMHRFLMNASSQDGSSLRSAPAVRETRSSANRDASLMNDGFMIEFESLTLAGAEFITVADALSGELTAVDPDFVIDAATGGTWANDFGILFTTVPLETGAAIDPSTVVLQAGGLTVYGPAGTRVPWVEGGSGTPGTAVTTPITIPTPLDMSGLYVSIGHAWTPGGASTWTGNVTLVGVSQGAEFITAVSPAMGTIAPGGSQVVELTLDATDLIGGEYSGILAVETNDPLNFEVAIPATLTVEGAPEITVDPTELDFGTVVVGEQAALSVTVSNTGSDVLMVSGFSTDDEQFSVESDSFDLAVGESADVVVTFAPGSSGSQSATLTFESNAGDATVALSGAGQDPGVLVFDPESLDVSVNVGENGMVSFLLSNEGVAPLEFSLSGGLVGNARFIYPTGKVTEVETEGQAPQRGGQGVGSHEFNTSAPANIRGGRSASADVEFPFVNRSILNDEIVLTHSLSQVVEPLNGVRCGSAAGTAANSYIRTYSLPDFDIDGDFNVTAVQFGLESVTGSLPVEARIYTLEGALNFANMTLLATSSQVTVSTADNETVITIPVEAEVPAGSVIVVEAFVPESTGNDLFPGTNSAGETSPSYIAADACSIFQPATYASIGFPEAHLILNVVGEAGDGLFVFEPATGTIEAGQSVEVMAEVNTFEFEAGSYAAEIQIVTNSPATPVGVIPVSIEVVD
ncbi:MAG: choice-of-anchor J domain-containing protein, partial [Balneolia bacterium]|nr:choice-of-anchor J domain-containing protein [Balneolia bacterium]